MSFSPNVEIRNLAIIAHVDHGKTTLVDALLKQGQVFRDHQQVGELIMDSNPLERERGITILAKNTSVTYKDVKINIIDTPGHADFSGEVERVMNMADGCLLVVDAIDGPMPQTHYVLRKALEQGVIPIVVINKIDRPETALSSVIDDIHDMFLRLAISDDQLDFPILYSSAKDGYAVHDPEGEGIDMQPLFETILDRVPIPSGDKEGSFQMLAAALDFDNHLGQIVIGRISRGTIRSKSGVVLLRPSGESKAFTLDRIYVFKGLERLEVAVASAGEIVALSGMDNVSIGDTLASPDQPDALPTISIGEPTVKMTFGVNTSPFVGKEGEYCTSRMLWGRLVNELRTNVSLRVNQTNSADEFEVSGRGELQLAILVETLRRERFEFQVSRPEPVNRTVNGKIEEPYEHMVLNTSEDYIGSITENLAGRLAELTDMVYDGMGNVRMEYDIPTRGLIGFGSFFTRVTRGNGTRDTMFMGYRQLEGEVKRSGDSVLIASQPGVSVTFGLLNAQGRGDTFIDPGTSVYEGMIIGSHRRGEDIAVNVCKEKKLTNMRSSTSEITKRLTPTVKLSLEEALDFIAPDELIEVTPQSIRMRKRELNSTVRIRQRQRVKDSLSDSRR